MEYTIREMNTDDKCEILSMMREFYASDLVFTNGSEEIFETDFENCINDNPYIEGYVFCLDGKTLGYAMIAKSFSTEFGKQCIWFEDLYIKPEYRGNGIAPRFLQYIKELYPECVYRLEVEQENTHATHVYKKQGFSSLPYQEMVIIK